MNNPPYCLPRVKVDSLIKEAEKVNDLGIYLDGGLIQACDRNRSVGWLISFGKYLDFPALIIQACITMFEHYQSLSKVPSVLQIPVIAVCLHISLKYSHFKHLTLKDVSEATGVDTDTVVAIECAILEGLNWEIKPLTVCHYIREILTGVNHPRVLETAENLSLYFYEDYYLRSFNLCEVAITCVLRACKVLGIEEYSRELVRFESRINLCERALNQALKL